MKKLTKIQRLAAYAIGAVLSIGLLVAGFSVIQGLTSRAEDQAPRDLVISDVTSNSAKVTWSTGTKNQGVMEYGTSPTTLNLFAPETENTINHKIDLTLLSANSSYYFDIKIGGKMYDNAGVPWTFSTRSLNSIESPNLSPTVLPTPISRVQIPNEQTQSSCNALNCEAMKALFGKGCTTQDYFKCLRKLTPTISK